jgi:hypothetical protein
MASLWTEEAMYYYFDVTNDSSPSIDSHGLDLNCFSDVVAVAQALQDEAEGASEVRIRSGFLIIGWVKGKSFVPCAGQKSYRDGYLIH